MIEREFQILSLEQGENKHFLGMLNLFGEVFEDAPSYCSAQPSDAYIDSLLNSDTFYALVAEQDGEVVGAIAGYELKKFEQERSEFYIYDLAVAEFHRRIGLATALIDAFGKIARERGAWTMYVQADPIDAAAVALYDKLGVREEVFHFDIEPK